MARVMRFILVFCLFIEMMSALNSFPDKFQIGEKHSDVTLTCHTDKHHIRWERHDETGTVRLEKENEYEKPNGHNLTVIDLQEDQIGNYSCWSDGVLLDYTYLLLDRSRDATVNINCTAETLSCTKSIKCSVWSSDDFTAFRLRNTRDQGDWVSQAVDGGFLLPHLTDSFSEESERLQVTGEAVSTCCYASTHSSFFLRDIVKPAVPNISVCAVENKEKDTQVIEVEVTPPPSWPQPHSFFPLKHQIEYERRHDGGVETKEWEEKSKYKVRGLITKLRVRSRDLLLLSQWSEWTTWKNVSNITDGNHTKRNKVANKQKKNKKKNCVHKHQKKPQKKHQRKQQKKHQKRRKHQS